MIKKSVISHNVTFTICVAVISLTDLIGIKQYRKMLRMRDNINKGLKTMRDIQSKVIKLVAEALGCTEDSLNMDSRLGHHEKWDSLGQISIVATIESKYNIEIDENNIDKLFSISDICLFVDNLKR